MGTFRISNVIKHFPTKCYNKKKRKKQRKKKVKCNIAM